MVCLRVGPLSDIQTPSIVPVDLNSILQANALALSVWFRQTGMLDKANKYSAISTDLLTSIQDVMVENNLNDTHTHSLYIFKLI